jgi:integrase
MVFRGVFTVAVEQDIIQRSPVRSSHMPEIHKKQKRIWSPDQVRRIIEAAPKEHKTFVTLVALTGVRLGELLAIQWKHLDFQLGSLLMAQSLWHGQIVPPKTEGSVRRIPIGPVLCEILKGHYGASRYRDPDDFLFCKGDGSPLHPDVVRKDVLYPILDRIGIERHKRESGFHAFRHCAASFINNETGNLKLVQSLLGHSNLSTTADIYTHNLTEAEREASEAMEKVIFGNLFPVVPNIGNENKSVPN